MTNKTIKTIQTVAKNIKNLSKGGYDVSQVVYKPDLTTYEDLLNDLERTIDRVITLSKTRNQFMDISSFNERKSILENLNFIHDKVKNSDIFLVELDALKSDIKHFAYIEYTKTGTTNIKNEVEKLKKEKNNLIKAKNQLVRATKTVSNNIERSRTSIEQSSENQKALNILGKVIEIHNEQLEKQDKKYKQYDKDIATYKNEKITTLEKIDAEHKTLLENAEGVIDKATKAMKLGEASGISAAFQSQYNEIKGNKNKGFWKFLNMFVGEKSWVWGAFLFSIIAIGIGIWLGIGAESLSINVVIARLSLIFISLTSASFCAGQYIKISNTATDYAYKVSLAKSIIAFSEQLKNDEPNDTSYQDYIKKILDEIHQHPLRNYKKQESVTIVEKIVKKVKKELSGDN